MHRLYLCFALVDRRYQATNKGGQFVHVLSFVLMLNKSNQPKNQGRHDCFVHSSGPTPPSVLQYNNFAKLFRMRSIFRHVEGSIKVEH